MTSIISNSAVLCSWPDHLGLSRRVNVSCNQAFNDFLGTLPMASEYKPFTSFETGLMAFSGGSSFVASMGLSNSLASQGFMYLSGLPYCGPYCLAFSYVISVGVGSFTTTKVNATMRSYFENKYKKDWLLKNQGRVYVEHGVLRKVPLFENLNSQSPPEGLAFISPFPFRDHPLVNTASRILVVTVISNVLRIVFIKVVEYTAKKLKRRANEGQITLQEGNSSENQIFIFDKALRGLEIYENLVS